MYSHVIARDLMENVNQLAFTYTGKDQCCFPCTASGINEIILQTFALI